MTSASPDAHEKFKRWLPLLLASLASVGPFSIDAYLPSMAEIGSVLNASPYAVQSTLTAYMVPFAIMMLWHGALSDALGRRTVILWGVGLFAVASAACAMATSIQTLLVFRAFQGMAAGAGMVVGRAVIRDLYHGADAQRVMSHVSLTFAIAPAVAPVIGGWLQVWFGWRAIFIFIVAFSSLAWFVCKAILPETLQPEKRQPLHPLYLGRMYWSVATSPRFIAASLALTFNFSGIFIYITSAPVFLMQHLHVPETGFIWLFGPVTAGSATGAWISGRSAGKITPYKTLRIAYSFMVSAALICVTYHYFFKPSLPLSVVPLYFYALGMSLAFPSLTIVALDLFPKQRGLAASCTSFISTSGAALNAVIAPLVWGSVFSLSLTAACAMLAGLISFIIFVVSGTKEPTHNESAAEVLSH
jgi:DHA1 family bicyclomycin/chloramphenicol resistance-like MFS transporter